MNFKLLIFSILLSSPIYSQIVDKSTINKTDDQGRKQGYWEKQYKNGKIAYSVFFKDDKPIGDFKRYFENGKIMAFLVYDDKSEYAKAKLYHNNGKVAAEGKYFLKLKDSTWTYYDNRERKVLVENYLIGMKHGPEIKYFPDLNLIAEEIYWKDSLKDGPYKRYAKNGNTILEMNYTADLRNGKFTVYHPTGNKYILGAYKNNKPTGFWTYLEENGGIIKTVEFNDQGLPVNNEELKKLEDESIRLQEKNLGKIKEPDFESVMENLYKRR